MKIPVLTIAASLVAASLQPGSAAVIISEVVHNEVGSDTLGEWIEIYNNGTSTIDLSNYKIGDEETSGGTGTGEAMFQFPSGASIKPGEVQIVSVSADRFNTVYGFLPTYEMTNSLETVPDLTVYSAWDPDGGLMAMANGNDQALILDGSDTIVDSVSWGSTFAFNPGLTNAVADGQSFIRTNLFIDTDTANDWILGPNLSTAAQRSTPGVASAPPVPSLTVVKGANEISMQFAGLQQVSYSLMASTNLVTWGPVQSIVAETNDAPVSFSRPTNTDLPLSFYRLRIP